MPEITIPDRGRGHVTITPETDNESLLAIDQAVLEELYKVHGAILFRGFSLDLEIFSTITSRFCTNSVRNESHGRKTVDEENNIQTVNLGTQPFPLHPEMSREPWKPDICWFACMNPPSSGAETIICDGTQVVKNLPSKVLKAFKTRRLLYTRPATSGECDYWLGQTEPSDDQIQNPKKNCPFKFFRTPKGIMRSFTAPLLHKPMFTNNLAFGNFLFFARYMHNDKKYPLFEDGSVIPDKLVEAAKKASDKLTLPIKWQKHDLVVLDNSRYMHGRNKIDNVDERQIISYFGYLKFARPSKEEPQNPPWRQGVDFVPG